MIAKAPWTDEEVDKLNAYQKAAKFHPYTCPGDFEGCGTHRELVATNEGWVCACGLYKQQWAHAEMAGRYEGKT